VPSVTEAVEALVRATADLPDEEMDRPWTWDAYDEEGLRFALLLAQHELRDLAVRMSALRRARATQAELILTQYHAAYRDLTGALAGTQDEDLDRAPAAEEWPVREVLRHMLGAEYGFLGVVQYARSPERPADAARAEAGLSGFRERHGYRGPAELPGGIAEVRTALFEVHRRVLRELTGLTDDELEWPAFFWDGERPIRFRLHRFAAHLVQHTIQVDKTLVAIGDAPTEAQRLVRILYRELAPVEMLAAGGVGEAERRAVAATLWDRAGEIEALVNVVPH